MSVAYSLSHALRVQPPETTLFISGKENYSYETVADAASALSAGLKHLQIPRRSVVAIASENSPEWLITDFACAFSDFLSVGVHISWPTSKMMAVMHDTNASVIVTSRRAVTTIHRLLSTNNTNVSLVVVVDKNSTDSLESTQKFTLPPNTLHVTYKTYQEIITLGNANPSTHTGYGFATDLSNKDLTEDSSQPFTLMYSSGTSGGPPKATATPKSLWMFSNCMPGPFSQFSIWERRAISYLSLAHGADRGVAWQCCFAGGTVGFAHCGEEDLSGLLEDMKIIRPTFLLGMANFWTAVYAHHLSRLEAALDEHLMNMLLKSSPSTTKMKDIILFKSEQNEVWSELRAALLTTRAGGTIRVKQLNLVRSEMGGALLTVATGGSLTPKVVRQFMSYVLEEGNETRVKDAYGLTEFPGISVNGEISPDVDLRLGPVVRDGVLVYDPNDTARPRGEILVRKKKNADNQNQSTCDRIKYWNRPDLDAEKFDKEGWYHTGDVGEMDYCDRTIPNQYHVTRSVVGHPEWRAAQPLLRVIDRVKSLEEIYWKGDSVWISVSSLEAVYGSSLSQWVKNVVLVSDRNESGLVAICLLTTTGEEMVTSSTLLSSFQTIGEKNQLKSYEVPLGVVCISVSKQNDLVTITGKAKRALIREKYHHEWMSVYNSTNDGATLLDTASGTSIAECIHELYSTLKNTGINEPGIQCTGTNSVSIGGSQSNRPLPIKRGHREVDCRIRIYSNKKDASAALVYGELDCLESKFSDKTVRGRDWLADMTYKPSSSDQSNNEDDTNSETKSTGEKSDSLMERRFEFHMVRSNNHEDWTALSEEHRSKLNDCLLKLQSAALVIRHKSKIWENMYKEQILEAGEKKASALQMFQNHVAKQVNVLYQKYHDKNKKSNDYDDLVVAAASSFLEGKMWLERANNQAERVLMPPEQIHAINNLEKAQLEFVSLGDELNVNTRELPYSWTVNNEWMVDDWRSEVSVILCPMCQQKIVKSELDKHTNFIQCTSTGLATEEQINAASDEAGVSLGGTSVKCDVTGTTIDEESKDLHDPQGSMPLSICPVRKPRVRGLFSNVNRFPWAHEVLSRFSSCLDHSNDLHMAWLQQLNPPEKLNDVWCVEKQGLHWLFDYIKYAGGQPFERTEGRTNTPSSLVVRACDAFYERPCLGVPDDQIQSEHQTSHILSRATPYNVLVKAAGMELYHYNSDHNKEEKEEKEEKEQNLALSVLNKKTTFGWLRYGDLGKLVDVVARGLIAMDIPAGMSIGVTGYNDIEFCVADLAIARAGMVSVGIHGTYTNDQLFHALNKSECVALLYMSDFEIKSSERAAKGLWCVDDLMKAREQENKMIHMLEYFVVMDDSCSNSSAASGSFVDWAQAVYSTETVLKVNAIDMNWKEKLEEVQLSDPFDARGSPFRSGIVKEQKYTTQNQDVTTILFTSGSSGAPKAVAVGVDAFVEDISAEISDAYAATSGLTISYIPLSHSSDRYKVWQHIIFGGRVAFVPFGAEQWEWREKDKESLPGSSPVELLFSMVASVRPTSMSCPPNIWTGLHDMYRTQLRLQNNDEIKALDRLTALTMGTPCRMKGMATGGAPTPEADMKFARMFCQHIGASVADSYGTTEAGAITSDGRQLSDKFKEVEIQLININLTTNIGEIVVKTPTCSLGYMGDPKKTKESFVEIVNENNSTGLGCGRWYKTGDLGHFDGTGRLILAGRASSKLNIEGSFMPLKYEVELLSEWSGKAIHVVLMSAVENEIVVLVHVKHVPSKDEIAFFSTSSVLDELRQHATNAKLHFTDTVWSVSNGLMTGSQKVSKKRVRDWYKDKV